MSNKEIALQIINFLKTAVSNKEVSEDYVESIDVAVDCIADAFEVSKDDDVATVKTAFNGLSLKEIVEKSKQGVSAEVPVHVEEGEKKEEVDEETKKQAEALKLEGNKAMARREFQEAVDKYTEAIALTPKNAVYLSNRAAAYSSLRKHEEAIEDANAAIEIDPSYSKAYSRLGLAYYALNKPNDALEAYKKGLETEGEKPTDAMKKGYETAKKRVEESLDVGSAEQTPRSTPSTGAGAGAGAGGMPDLSSLASMLGGGSGGGMPNFSDMMNNPQIMQAAQQMMSNPSALQNLMSNPAIQQMAQQFGGGGNGGSEGGLDMEGLMNNPALRNMANSFMGGNRSGNSDAGSGAGSE